jgi:hypothetical protein
MDMPGPRPNKYIIVKGMPGPMSWTATDESYNIQIKMHAMATAFHNIMVTFTQRLAHKRQI